MDNNSYLTGMRNLFAYYRQLGEKTFGQMTDEQLSWQYNAESNSVAIIVKHLWGNMLSRWTDFLTSDGEKEWRHRDAEFDIDIRGREELMSKWNEGWDCLFAALEPLEDLDLNKEVSIRNQKHTVSEAINRQLAHYAYHVGQIVYVGKMVSDSQWQSLSIPRGKSDKYNQEKFAQQPERRHFTEEYLKKQKP